MSVQVSLVIHADQHFEVHTQTLDPDPDYFRDGARIASVRIGGPYDAGGVITIQGDPADMLAMFDRVFVDLAAACGRAWPVEAAPEVAGV